MPIRINLFFFGKRTLNKRGIGMLRMMRSELMLNTALVMRWFVAAEHCAVTVSVAHKNVTSARTGVGRYCPVLVERPAPYAEVQNLHDHKCDSDVNRRGDDQLPLWQDSSHAEIHNEQTCLDQPDGGDLHLLYSQNVLGSGHSIANFGFRISGNIVTGRYEIR
jgi:hypothetical protein